jgi:hypothetical protein
MDVDGQTDYSRDARRRGWLAWWGYDFNEQTRRIAISPRFHRTCGTNCAINWVPDELPATPFQQQDALFRRSVEVGNSGTAWLFQRRGEPLTNFWFPAAIYLREHGDNRPASSTPMDGDAGRSARSRRRAGRSLAGH